MDALKVTPLSDEGGKRGNGNKREAPPFKKVIYSDLWKGITAIYKAAGGGLAESTYVIEPGADVGRIRLRYNVGMEIQKDGSLRFSHPTRRGYFTKSAPMGWQEIRGKRVPVEVGFKEYGENMVGFKVGEYDPVYPLNIAPTYKWHTFYGSGGPPNGYGSDNGHGIAVDGSSNVYVTGLSWGTWQGDGGTDPLHAHSGGYDIGILKLDSSGQYQWHTFYGSGVCDYGNGITVQGSGNVYVTGGSGGMWQGDGGGNPLHAYTESSDIVVVALSGTGTIYVSQDGLCADNSPCYSTIQNGIASASIPSVIKITQETYNEDIFLNFNQVVVLEGGWDTNFTSCSSATIINGSLTITNGTMVLGGAGILILE